MTTAVNHQASNKVKLTGRLSEFRDALQEEIKEIEKNGQNSTLLLGGHRIEAKGEGFWYRFFVEYMPLMPADTPCKLTVGTDQYDVTVISSNENEIILSSKNKLPANIGKAKLENGSTVLMERLIKCIEDNAEKKNPAGERMFPDEAGKGTKAAAVTVAYCVGGLPPKMNFKEVYLDRPFIFALMHGATGLPVFIGVVRHLDDAKQDPERLMRKLGRARRLRMESAR